MIALAPHVTAFLRVRLPIERGASPNTCDTYAYALKLLFGFLSNRLKVAPSDLELEQIDAAAVLAFLEYLERHRGCCATTRNARLAAIKSFMRFVEHRVPSALDQVRRILAIPSKKADSRLVAYLRLEEVQALLDAPDPATRSGIRDQAMLHLAFAGGLRVSELVGLQLPDLILNARREVRIHGKGRRERILPLWKQTATALRAWLKVRGDASTPELFLNARGEAMSRSGFEYVLAKYARIAAAHCPSVAKRRLSPHVLRHSCAMTLLAATHDVRKVSLWLGHASIHTTEVYTRADPGEKLDAAATVVSPTLRRGRFRVPDQLIASLTPSRTK
jgi:site-specific recombinase XerD